MKQSKLQTLSADILERFDIVSSARDRALAEGRQIVRLSANTVRAVHRGETEEARVTLADAKAILENLIRHLEPFPSIYWAGYVQDGMKEFTEACVTLAIVSG